MEILSGHPVSPGYAKGKAVVYAAGASVEVPRYKIERTCVDGEIERFHQALERSLDELRQLERQALAELGDAYSSIFSAHLALVQDQQFTERVRQRVRADLVNAEQALDAQIADLARLLGTLESEYLRERARDIRDIGGRLMRHLIRGDLRPYVDLQPDSVIVARELLPSETIQLDRAHVVGIVTEQGGENSHAAILARAMGIPAVTGVAEATSRIADGTIVLVDGSTGRVSATPTESALANFARVKSHYNQASAAAVGAEGLECITADGTRISLLANLNREEEATLVKEHHLDGVGLFRTEFLYMDSPAPPGYEEQLDVYRGLLETLNGGRLVVRTLDLGGDKVPTFLVPHQEANPHIGLRGLRFSLAHDELFTPQLRALLAARVHGDIRILFPMVLGESDLAEARRRLEALAEEGELPCAPLGAMIECPSALFSLKEILRQVDFASIGTNDLTQFMLAADRDAVELIDDYSVLHPSVLRAIRQVVEACDEAGRELSVCGEAAGDEQAAGLLIGLGVRQLSMSPVRAARVRQAIRKAQVSELADIAEQALKADSAATVKGLLREIGGDISNTHSS